MKEEGRIDSAFLEGSASWHAPVFISLGSNIGDRVKNLNQACALLAKGDGVSGDIVIKSSSSMYRSSAMYDKNQPYFLNMVCCCATILEPLSLLSTLQDIERALGRNHSPERFAARIIDLDIIYYEAHIIAQRGLCIPHPRLYERAFVLNPLAEIADSFCDPRRDCSVKVLQQELGIQMHAAVKI